MLDFVIRERFKELPDNTVLPDRNIESKVIIVGEAPGAVELKEGKYFVGPSGRVLNHALGECGHSRSDIYITNVVKRKLEGNSYNNIDKDELDKWKEILLVELMANPEGIIIGLGGIVQEILTDMFWRNEWSGNIQFIRDQIYVIPKSNKVMAFHYHPSYIVRTGGTSSPHYPKWRDALHLSVRRGLYAV